MDDLFRFITVRPPQKVDVSVSVPVTPTAVFQRQLSVAKAGVRGGSPLQALQQAATQHFVSVEKVGDLSSLTFGKELSATVVAFEAANDKTNLAATKAIIATAFTKGADKVIADNNFQTDVSIINDNIVAIILVPEAHRAPLAELCQLARAAQLIQRAGKNDTTLDNVGSVPQAMSATLILPPSIFPLVPNLIQPVGIADLLVVKQQLTGYELGEISTIENILKGESKDHIFDHTLTTSQTFTTETSTTKEDLKDLQTTDRFELKTEADKTIQEDTSVKAGVSVTAKYGDSLQVQANADVAYSNSKTEATKLASSYSKDVVSRATSKVVESVRQEQTTTTTETFHDTDTHGFDNSKGTGNIIGVYQWVNKIYEAQIFNYGKRLLFDIMIPEPAAFLLEAVTTKSKTENPVKPDDFTLLPSDLTDDASKSNYYQIFVKKYGAAGVDPPPSEFITTSKAYSEKTDNNDGNDQIVKDFELSILDGYEALDGFVSGTFNFKNNDPAKGLRVFVGKELSAVLTQTGQPVSFTFGANKVRGTLPISIETKDIKDYSVNIVVNCPRTQRSMDKWKLDTHGKILQAYQNQLSDYQNKITAQSFTKSKIGPLGSSNPDENRRTERIELKKCCIAFLSGQDIYDLAINSVTENPPAVPPAPPVPLYPRPNLVTAEKQGAYIRFFEQAFEWEQMMYYFYPYYWSRREKWYDLALLDNSDPIFAQFLKAGEARAVVPVRPSFEHDLRYFLMTGQIWEGGTLPEVTDSDYLPITEEIKESADAPGDEIPVGDPWKVKLPTSLIKLREDGQLPQWMKTQVNGKDAWVPAKRDQQGNLVPE